MHILKDLNAFQDKLKANKKCRHDFVSVSLIFYSIVCRKYIYIYFFFHNSDDFIILSCRQSI